MDGLNMIICPACGFESEYFQGLRVGNLRGCGRCGLFSLLHLCNKCQTISLQKSGSTLCACGKREIVKISNINETSFLVAAWVGGGSFIFITIGRWIEAGKPTFGDDNIYRVLLKFLLSEGHIFYYGFGAAVNAGLAWVLSVIILKAMGKKFHKELA